MSAFTDVLAAHSRVRHPRAETDFALMCACGWETIVTLDEIEYEPDRYLDAEPLLLARHAAHVEVELAKAGIAITQLPEPDAQTVAELAEDALADYLTEVDTVGFWNVAGAAERVAAALLAAAASIPTKETP